MRQEPKIYESTKPKDAAVDTDVLAAHITDDGFHDMINVCNQGGLNPSP